MACRIPKIEDVPVLLSYMPSIQHDAKLSSHMERTLRWYADQRNSCAHPSFARVVEVNGTVGHISANFIHTSVADNIERRGSKEFLFDPDVNEPLSNVELREANQGKGACLLLTTFFRNRPEPSAAHEFATIGFAHLARWFTGNTIDSFAFYYRTKYADQFGGWLGALDPSMLSYTEMETGDTFVRIRRPWSPKGPGPEWLAAVLAEYPRPVHVLDDDLKLTARLFFEYRFQYDEVVPSCFPKWSRDIEKLAEGGRSRNVDAFFEKIGNRKQLGLSGHDGRGNIRPRVERLLERNPRILALY